MESVKIEASYSLSMWEQSSVVQMSDSTVKTEPSCSPPMCEESNVVQVSDSSETLAQGTKSVAGTPGRRTHLQIKSLWNLRQVFTELATREDCIRFSKERGLIPVTKMCSYHKRPMKLSTAASSGQLGMFRCPKSNCRMPSKSRSQGTWFENVHLELPIVFQIMYLFCHGASYDDVQRETSLETGPVVSTSSIAHWYNSCRETISIYELDNQMYETRIGGPDKTVQIHKSKFGKRKYYQARDIEGHWVVGMMEKGSDDIRLEVCPDNEQTVEVLVSLIQKHVAEGSIIQTNSWKAFDCLPEYGYILKKVDQGNQDIVALNEIQNQQIESHGRSLRRQFQRDQYMGNFEDRLTEFSWRRKNRMYNKDPFEELIIAIKHVYNFTQNIKNSPPISSVCKNDIK